LPSFSEGAPDYPFILNEGTLNSDIERQQAIWNASVPFRHIVIDSFLPDEHIKFLSDNFPLADHPVWLDWKVRSKHQWGKQGPGNSLRFSQLDPGLLLGLNEFNTWKFLSYLENLTGIEALLPDPYFTGGGIHQILKGGILDIHTDFNDYGRLRIYRRLNVLLYMTRDWREEYGGSLQLWDNAPQRGGRCVKSIAPIFNRCVIFETDKTSFHGHPEEWNAPEGLYRRSIALYYYTATKRSDRQYDGQTDFQGYAVKELPASEG
jgi:Rps23 Pro-64 3,4-dihydroxylase Tpa1-like proline 4-hydroxylase